MRHDKLEEGDMSEIGNMPNVAYGAEVTNPTHNGISDSIKTTTATKIPDDDAAVAIIRNAHRAEILNIQQDADNGSDTTYKQLADEVASGRFSPKNLREQIEKIANGRFSQKNLREQIEATQSLEDFGKDVLECLAKYKKLAEDVAGGHFSLKNLRDQTGKIAARRSATMETDNGLLAWLRDEAVQALPWQEDLEPERVLLLLKDVPGQTVAERVMEQAGVIPGQIISAQESEKA